MVGCPRQMYSKPLSIYQVQSQKVNAKCPDFKHRKTQYTLWLGDQQNPPMDGAELVAWQAGSVELDIYLCVKRGLQDMSRLGNMRRHDVKGRSFTFAQLKSLAACCSEVYRFHYLSSLWKAGSLTITIQSTCEANNAYVGSSLVDIYA